MTVGRSIDPGLAVHFPRVIITRAVGKGASRRELLEAAQLSELEMASDNTRISPAQLGGLLRAVWIALDDELAGFGAAPHRFGGFALMARQMVECATLGEALRYSVRFYNLTSSALRWTLNEGRPCQLKLRLLRPDRDQEHFLEEFLLVTWHRFCNWLIGERIPLTHTSFHFPAPPHSEEYRLMFPGPVTFHRPYSGISFDSAWMAAPVIRSRQELRRYLGRLPDEWFVKQDFEGSVSERVLRILADSPAQPSLQQLSEQWGMSSRTLHRQLGKEGTSFRMLREQVRRERAIGMLLDGRTRVRDIAQALEMTEPAFSRAFKQWTGMSPLAFRRARAV
jgi:AraC-like DNA-binding protein